MIIDSYKHGGGQEPILIIDNISKKVPKKVETYHGKDEESEVIIKNRIDYSKNIYSKKIINAYSKKIIGSKDPYPILHVNIESSPRNSNINKKYIYREIIKTEIKDENQENQENNENGIKMKDDDIEENYEFDDKEEKENEAKLTIKGIEKK